MLIIISGGYKVVIDDSAISYNLVPYWQIAKTIRCVDPGCTNTLLSGLFLHATHKPATLTPPASNSTTDAATLVPSDMVDECRSSRFSSLASVCSNQGGSPIVSSSTMKASQGRPRPVGVDPAFNPSSTLYNPNLDPSLYYNMSSPLEVNPLTGLPYAFFHQPIPNRPNGYPVLVSEYLSQSRAGQTYEFLQDGDFLDPEFITQLTIEMVTYNQGARILAYFSAVADWLSNGEVKMTYTINALPITIDGTPSQIGYSAALIALACIYLVLAIHDTYSVWSIEKKSRWGAKEFKISSQEEYGGKPQDSGMKDRMQYSRQQLRDMGVSIPPREKRLRAGGELWASDVLFHSLSSSPLTLCPSHTHSH